MRSSITLITQAGMNAITEASELGALVSVCYYVPVYDYRIDKSVSAIGDWFSDTNELDITKVASVNDTVPTGDVFWNTNDPLTYGISQDKIYIPASVVSQVSNGGQRLEMLTSAGIANHTPITTAGGLGLVEYYTINRPADIANYPTYNAAGNYWDTTTDTWDLISIAPNIIPAFPSSPSEASCSQTRTSAKQRAAQTEQSAHASIRRLHPVLVVLANQLRDRCRLDAGLRRWRQLLRLHLSRAEQRADGVDRLVILKLFFVDRLSPRSQIGLRHGVVSALVE
jgi:hypothetical protein